MADIGNERPGESPMVEIEWLREHLSDPSLRIVDVRAADHFWSGHIPGAVHSDLNLLRLDDSSPESISLFQQKAILELRRLGINPGDRVVFYEGFSGASAARGVWLLDYLGIPGGSILNGGISAWVRVGGEVSRQISATLIGSIESNVNPGLLATADELLEAIADPQNRTTILDTRSDLEYQLGTIPSSVHLEWLHHLTEAGEFRTQAELSDLYI